MRLSVVGLPGSGKTTISEMLANSYGWKHVSSGDLVRKHLLDTHTTNELSKGNMAPDENAVQTLIFNEVYGHQHYILDGFPRIIEQLFNTKIQINAVLYLMTNNQVVRTRLLKRGRIDDTTEVINKRIDNYWELTFPVIPYFSFVTKTQIIVIDASQSISKVWEDAVEKLDTLAETTEAARN